MRLTIFCYIIKINNIGKLNETEIKLSKLYLSGKMMVFGTSSRLFLFIITLCIIFHLNQAAPIKRTHINLNIKCGSEMMKDTFSRIQITPLIFTGTVIKKEKIPELNSNWKLVAYVEVKYIIKDIFTPHMLSKLRRVWIGPFTDQINVKSCISMIRNQSSQIFFATPLSNSNNSLQSLYQPLLNTENNFANIKYLLQKKAEKLSIFKIHSQNIRVEGKIDVQCEAQGFPNPQYYWFKNDREPILKPNYNSRLYYTKEGIKSILHIENVEKADEANYTCKAENIYESISSTFQLQVWETAESKRKCKNIPNFCVNGSCNKDKITCRCDYGYSGRRCNYRDSQDPFIRNL